VQKHEERLTGAWRQMSTLRPQYERWCKGDDIKDYTHKQRYEASYQNMVEVLQQNTWIDDRNFLKSCVRAIAEQDNINYSALYGTWTGDFMLRQKNSKVFLGKYSKDPGPRVPWRHKRRHHFIWRHLHASMQAAQTPASKLRFVALDKESSMYTLWQEEEF